jgi:polyhydroxyalkanoate synthase
MVQLVDPAVVLARIRRDVDRMALRTRNGLKHLAGVGRPEVGITAKDEVWGRDRVRLYRYRSDQRRLSPPVLLVMSLVTKPYVFDLRPGNSFVESLLMAGFDVYSLDWGTPDTADSANTFETYCDEYLPRASAAVLEESGTDELTVYGYCLGAVLSLLFVAGHPEVPVRALGLMATPIDLVPLGPMTSLLGSGRLSVDDIVDETGNVPARVVLDAIRNMKATGDLASYANLLSNLESSEYIAAHQALIGWAQDHIPFPGACARQAVDWFMKDDQLVQGRVTLGGREVDFRSITCPVLSVVGDADHVVPPASTAPLLEVVPQTETLAFRAGHVGLMVGGSAQRRSIPGIAAWLAAHSDAV